MRTVTYKSVLDGTLRMAAEDPVSVADTDKAELMEYLSDALQRAREYYRWPDLLTIEARYFRDVWAAGSYGAEAQVYDEATAAYYEAAVPVTLPLTRRLPASVLIVALAPSVTAPP